ncbi:hypothetical protein [Ruicaihuangia caeni]|uniref:Multidrug ABC transporter ATPase n=1 Tax=Ruicaihuangia caeni TaxID=3042517 RepID=A0AAW6T7S5_9MICO|nr:hypothetical protein [Klugiella sp. YN-L-19]MDI2098771.1 hypothetical protein [Klugiella sp. YN-L-19]
MAQRDDNPSRLERVFSTLVAVVIGVALLCFVAMIVGTLTHADLGSGFWPIVAWIPYVGLPIGFVLIVALLILSARRRGKASRDAGR